MKTLLIITFIDFWRGGAGHRARLNALIAYLKETVKITVVYLGVVNDEDESALQKYFPEIALEPLERNIPLSYRAYGEKFALYSADRTFDVILVEYLELAFMLSYMDKKGTTILDIHDILSDKVESFKNANLHYDGLILSAKEEFELYDHFNYVIAIQNEDYRKICAKMGMSRALLVPHSVSVQKRRLKEHVSTIGYVGSEYLPNVDALAHFLTHSWKRIYSEFGLSLHIYGNICSKLTSDILDKSPKTKLFGFYPDLNYVYENSDIMINPVRCGAGLKIKNVEAIANGLPLITTSHGAIGMEHGINKSFLIANSSDEFILQIRRLVDDSSYRMGIGDNAYRFGRQHFSPTACYAPLLKMIIN